jgi:hypothetical protein
MAQAKRIHITRRPAPGMPLDPIFDAIEKHKEAYHAFSVVVTRQDELEAEVTSEKRQSRCDYHDRLQIVETDDPRWIEFQKEYERTNDAETQSAIDLINVEKLSFEGVVALLEYVQFFKDVGREFPRDVMDDDGLETTWERCMLRNVVSSLIASVRN